MTIDTKLVHFAETGAKSSGRGKKSVGLMLILPKAAAKDKTEKGLAESSQVAPLLFKDVKIGTEISSASSDQNLFPDQRISLTLTEADAGPVNIYAVINESEEPHLFEELILKAVTDNRDELRKALSKTVTDDAINQSRRQDD